MSSLRVRLVPRDVVEVFVLVGALALAVWILFFRWPASQSVFAENWQGLAVLAAGVGMIGWGFLVRSKAGGWLVGIGGCMALLSEGLFLS